MFGYKYRYLLTEGSQNLIGDKDTFTLNAPASKGDALFFANKERVETKYEVIEVLHFVGGKGKTKPVLRLREVKKADG